MGIGRFLVPNVIRRRYAVKFGIALLILGLSVGLIGFVATTGITNEVEQRVLDEHAAAAEQEAQNLQLWNEQNEQVIAQIVWSDSIDERDVDAIDHRFDVWQEYLAADIFSLHYVDTDSNEVLASTDDSAGASVSSLDIPDRAALFDEATVHAAAISTAYRTEDAIGQEAAVITYVQEVPNQDDRAVVYTANLESYVTRFQSDEGTATMVLDGNDEVMLDAAGFGEDYATLGEAYDADSPIPGEARQGGSGADRVTSAPAGALALDAYNFTAEDYIVSYAPVYGTDDEAMWVLATHEPTDDAYGFVNQVDQYGMLATLLGVLLIGLVGAVLGRNTAVSVDRLTERAGRMEEGELDVDFETDRIDNIGRLYDGFASMRDALRDQIDRAETAREEAEAERQRVQRINDRLEARADEYSDVMETAADGDLTVRMAADGENEAMNEIASSFNEMLTAIESTVDALARFATDVATASEEVTASSEEVRSASEQVTESVQEISEGADRQNDSLQSVNSEMEGLSTTTEEIAAHSNEVADVAERTAAAGDRGKAAADEAIDAMTTIEEDADRAVEEIGQLEEEVHQIDELISTISEIAKQTNMLALNANIEASRSAGGDDEGFTVVAQEVKELSQDVKAAAEEIERRLTAIRSQTETSAAEVERTSDQVGYVSDQVEEAVSALDEIAEYAVETNDGVQEISATTEEQAASTEEVVAMVDDAASISEQTTAEAQTVAAAAEEQTTALTQVTRSASDLSTQAARLSEALDRFETEASGTELGFDEAEAITEADPTDVFGTPEGDVPGDADDLFDPPASDDAATTEEPDGAVTVDEDAAEPADRPIALGGETDDEARGDEEVTDAETEDGDSETTGADDDAVTDAATEDDDPAATGADDDAVTDGTVDESESATEADEVTDEGEPAATESDDEASDESDGEDDEPIALGGETEPEDDSGA